MNLISNNRGQGLTEYISLLLLVAILSIAAAKSLGGTIKSKIETAQRHIRSDLSLEK